MRFRYSFISHTLDLSSFSSCPCPTHWAVFVHLFSLSLTLAGLSSFISLFTHSCGFLPSVLFSFPSYWAVSLTPLVSFLALWAVVFHLLFFSFSLRCLSSSLVFLLTHRAVYLCHLFLFCHTSGFLSLPSHWAVFLHLLPLFPSTAGCRPSSLVFSSLALNCLPSSFVYLPSHWAVFLYL